MSYNPIILSHLFFSNTSVVFSGRMCGMLESEGRRIEDRISFENCSSAASEKAKF